ncbi:unnamed protein product [Linum tenue]|uniref:Hexosyltransferase n=1 Tax=Linum tenue TaxID=586396 RepID=A0AAV0LJR8_9ROSI|nr:unnamed protein product [Linum tenue]
MHGQLIGILVIGSSRRNYTLRDSWTAQLTTTGTFSSSFHLVPEEGYVPEFLLY